MPLTGWSNSKQFRYVTLRENEQKNKITLFLLLCSSASAVSVCIGPTGAIINLVSLVTCSSVVDPTLRALLQLRFDFDSFATLLPFRVTLLPFSATIASTTKSPFLATKSPFSASGVDKPLRCMKGDGLVYTVYYIQGALIHVPLLPCCVMMMKLIHG